MKMLVCTDGSKSSKNAIKEAATLATNYQDVETSILYVYDTSQMPTYDSGGGSMPEEMKVKFEKSKREEGEKILQEAVKVFKEMNLEPTIILKKGHPSNEIVKVASEGDFDLVVLGNRGLSGFKKIFLGSVSNAVAQEVKSNVFIVKQQDLNPAAS